MSAARLIALTTLVLACGGPAATQVPTLTPATAGPSTPAPTSVASEAGGLPAAETLCALLTADDFGQFGFVTAAEPGISSDGPGTAYCVYAGESGASGGIELDVFVDETAADAEETFRTITEDGELTDAVAVELAGADAAVMDNDIADTWAAIAVRRDTLTYTIALPPDDDVEGQLTTLAAAVLGRSGDL